MEEEYTYTTLQYFMITFLFFKPILDIILSYFINKFKDKKNNLLLFYSITFGLYFILLAFTEFKFLSKIKRHMDFTEYFALGFSLFLILDLIVTAIYFKKNKKIFITFLSITFLMFISCIIYTYIDNCCELFLNINDYIIDISSFIIFILKTIFSAIYTVYLIFKLGIKIKNNKTNQLK